MKAYTKNRDVVAMDPKGSFYSKIADTIKYFKKPELTIDISNDDFNRIQKFASYIREDLDRIKSARLRNSGMNIRITEVDDVDAPCPEFTVYADFPGRYATSTEKLIKIVSTNIYLPISSCGSFVGPTVYKATSNPHSLENPVYMMFAVNLSAPEFNEYKDMPMCIRTDIQAAHFTCLPFTANDGVDHHADMKNFNRNKVTSSMMISVMEASVIFSIMHEILPREYHDKLFVPMGDNHYRVDMSDEEICTEAFTIMTMASRANLCYGFIIEELNKYIDDEISIDNDGIDKLISLWRGDDFDGVPSDLIDDGTLPMIACCINVSDENRMYKIIINPNMLVDANAEGYMEVTLSTGITIPKFIRRDENGHLCLEANADDKNSKKILKAWYGIQLSLLNPIIKERCERISTNTVQIESVHAAPKKKDQYRRVRHYYNLIGDNVTKIVDGECRHNHRHTMSWYVIGHWRTYSNGHRVFVKGHWRGPLKEMKSGGELREREIDV